MNTTIFVRLPTKADQKPQGFIDPELQDWVTMFGFPVLTSKEQMEALEKKRPIFKKARDKMGYFFSTERGRRTRDKNERIRRDWFAINKFAEEQGEARGETRAKVDDIVLIVKSRFPDEYLKSSDDLNALLSSKSLPELNELMVALLNCASYQDVASRL